MEWGMNLQKQVVCSVACLEWSRGE